MEKADTIALSLTDLVFEHRNKSYGAYELRTIHKKYLQKATIIGVTAFGLILAVLWNAFAYSPESNLGPIDCTIELTDIPQPPDDVLTPPPPPPPTVPEPQIKTKIWVEMQVVPAEAATEEITRNEELLTSAISNINQDGIDAVDENPVMDLNTNVEAPGVLEEEKEVIFTAVEQMPQFPDLAKFLSQNLRFPSSAVQKGISGVVYVSFVVSSQGAVQDIQLAKGIDEACDKEALRVVGKMPNWKPGRQNGRAVSVRYTIPIRFALQQQN